MGLKLKLEIRAEIRKDGRLIRRLPWKPANSLLKQFIQILAAQSNIAAQVIKKSTGADVSVSSYAIAFRSDATAGTTSYGILIGTGTDPVTMTDYKLQTQVTTNIAHGAHSLAVENPAPSSWRMVLWRTFTNNTGALLTIREVAWYVLAGSVATDYFCADRSLYTVSVAAGATITLYYRITATL